MALFEKISRVNEPRIPAQMVVVKTNGILESLPTALNYLQGCTLETVSAANENLESANERLEQLLAELDWHEDD